MRAWLCNAKRLAGTAVCLLLLTACGTGVERVESPTTAPSVVRITAESVPPFAPPTRTPDIAPQPATAQYLGGMIPSPGTVLNVRDYREGKHNDHDAAWATVESVAQSICVELDAFGLLEPGDDFTKPESIIERTVLVLDDLQLSGPDQIGGFLTLTWLGDGTGNKVAVAGGPYVFCWKLDLPAGKHIAHLKVRKTSGQVLEYRWPFTLTDD